MTASQRATRPNRVRPAQLPKPANDNYPGRSPNWKPAKLPIPANDNANAFRRAARTSLRRGLGPMRWIAPLLERSLQLNTATQVAFYNGYMPGYTCLPGGYPALSGGQVPCGNVANYPIGRAARTRPDLLEMIARQSIGSFTENVVQPRRRYETTIEQWITGRTWVRAAGATNTRTVAHQKPVNLPEVVRLPALRVRSIIAANPAFDPNIRRKVNPGRQQALRTRSQQVPDY